MSIYIQLSVTDHILKTGSGKSVLQMFRVLNRHAIKSFLVIMMVLQPSINMNGILIKKWNNSSLIHFLHSIQMQIDWTLFREQEANRHIWTEQTAQLIRDQIDEQTPNKHDHPDSEESGRGKRRRVDPPPPANQFHITTPQHYHPNPKPPPSQPPMRAAEGSTSKKLQAPGKFSSRKS